MAVVNCDEVFSSIQWKLVTDVINEKGFGNGKVTVNAVGEAGDNFIAAVVRVTADKNGETFKMIAKVAPRNEQTRLASHTRVLFINEHVMYTEVFAKFTELEKAAGIPEDERFRYPVCYGTITEEFEELILLEDLIEAGFTMLDRFKSLSDNDIRLVLKNFARLHSLSYALKDREPETYASYKNKLIDYLTLAPKPEDLKYFELIELDLINTLKAQKYVKFIKGTISKILDLAKKEGNWDENSRYSVIHQGDGWTNNIMFRLHDGVSESCCIIDYQVSRVASPVADLLFSLLTCTDYEMRKQHYISWIDFYHSELAKCLYEFGLKVDFVYPRDQLDADLKRHAKMGLIRTILVALMLSRESAEAAKIIEKWENDDGEEVSKDEMFEIARIGAMSEKAHAKFKSKVEDLIDTCVEFGLIH
ncbi:ecdysteroid kinase domain-containing protein [Phthorimaea operculella]|nr:ecdysteroid kinase domain-containing protein [Phthorimaea operculella]